MLQLKFDANQAYQRDAVESVTRLFEGLPRHASEYALGGDVVPNPEFYEFGYEDLESNLRPIQESNKIERDSERLEEDNGPMLEGVSDERHQYPNFTIEMETGTGKTYVYLRTIYELRKKFGFGKFIIVVPSIAIYEGVVKNFQITRSHFRALYDNEVVNLTEYDGAQLSRLRSFSSSTFCEVMVMTLDAFNKATNNIYKPSEKLPGERKPFEYVQATRPILILDEPQNMESEKSRQALRTLKPLFALRYSATHRRSPNLVYRLTPVDAYKQGLVKRIQVVGVIERENASGSQVRLKDIKLGKAITATLETPVTKHGKTQREEIVLRQGNDLFAKTKRDEHFGWVVEEINAAQGFIAFANGELLRLSQEDEAVSRETIFRQQIRSTIEEHIDAQLQLQSRGVKVLSLFFIDRVVNYTSTDGLIRRIFDEEFERFKHRLPSWRNRRPDEARQAYFATSKVTDGKAERDEAIDTSSGTLKEREAEKRAFELIMKNKERLLSFEEPVCFVFTHSALREGWDNPNVFQICTLRQSSSEIERRQTVGRGLRLCVNQHGERVLNEEANVLTVIANESFEAFSRGLQSEYVATGDIAPPLPTDKRRSAARRNDDIYLNDHDFLGFWRQLGKQVAYRLSIDTPVLIEESIARLNKADFPRSLMVIERGIVRLDEFRVKVLSIDPQRRKVELLLNLFDIDGNPNKIERVFDENAHLERVLGDPRLKELGVLKIVREGGAIHAAFDTFKLGIGEEKNYSPGSGATKRERIQNGVGQRHPVFNLIERAARETTVTRATLNAIFRGMRDERKRMVFDNPEGFAGVFITEIRNAVADHMVERLQFVDVDDGQVIALDEYFPPTRTYAQKEVIEAGRRGLYDLVQKDSEIEQFFVDRLKKAGEEDQITFFFKFPSAFTIKLPALIGNYNPDWGIGRITADGRRSVHPIVRETKGSSDITKLQFEHEKRKIKCAQKYFAALNIDYWQIDPHVDEWWKLAAERPEQIELH